MDTLPQTLQDYFNIAWKHAVVDKAPHAGGPNGIGCYYRTGDGRKCLIGAAILNEHYTPQLDEQGGATQALGYLRDQGHNYGIPEGVRGLQGCHDSRTPGVYADNIEKDLKQFAFDRGLSIPGEVIA